MTASRFLHRRAARLDLGALGGAGLSLVVLGALAIAGRGSTEVGVPLLAIGAVMLIGRYWIPLADHPRRLAAVAFVAAFIVFGGLAEGGEALGAWRFQVPLLERSLPKSHDREPDEQDEAPLRPPAIQPPIRKTSVTKQRVVQPARLPTIRHPGDMTYADLCGNTVPGAPAPERYANKLLSALLGGDGRDGLGANVAGCPGQAQPLPGDPPGWYDVGYCGGDLRSLGLAVPGHPGVLLLQDAGAFALKLARQGRLVAATPMIPTGDGGFHVVNTTDGDYVLIRKRSGAGFQRAPAGLIACDSVSQRAPYAIVPPALISLWRTLFMNEWAWPQPASPSARVGWSFENVAGDRVATATCASDLDCTMQYRGELVHSTEHARISAAQIQEYAPGAR